MKELIVSNIKNEKKLLYYIKDCFPNLSSSLLYKALRNKDIRVNGKRINDANYILNNNDIIVDDEDILYVYRKYKMKAFNGEHTHDEVHAIPKRNDHEKILKNFNKIIEKYKRK